MHVGTCIRGLTATVVLMITLPLFGCHAGPARPTGPTSAAEQPSPPSTSTHAPERSAGTQARPQSTLPSMRRPELERLHNARSQWLRARSAGYRMHVVSSGMSGEIECSYVIDHDESTLVSGPLRRESDMAAVAHDDLAVRICDEFATVDDVFDHLEELLGRDDEFAATSVTYDDIGVPVLVQYPGDPANDGGGTLTVLIEPVAGQI